MDETKLAERQQRRVVNRLAAAGFDGMRRSALVDVADKNNYRRGAARVDHLLDQHVIERYSGHYRLELLTVDKLAHDDPALVAHWFDLSRADACRFRQWRVDYYSGFDVILEPFGCRPYGPSWSPDGKRRRPPYHYGGLENLTDHEVALAAAGGVVRRKPDGFWSSPELASAAGFWQ